MDGQGAPPYTPKLGAVHGCEKQSTSDTGTSYHLKYILNF